MERLTNRCKIGLCGSNKKISLFPLFKIGANNIYRDRGLIQECFNRLAEYEDTGLAPEQIKNLHNKYCTLLEMYDKLQKDRDYWEREAKKYCAQLGENLLTPEGAKYQSEHYQKREAVRKIVCDKYGIEGDTDIDSMVDDIVNELDNLKTF